LFSHFLLFLPLSVAVVIVMTVIRRL